MVSDDRMDPYELDIVDIVRTGNRLQPFQVTSQCPRDASRVMARVA